MGHGYSDIVRDVPRFVAAPLIAARRFLDWPRVRWVRRLVGELSRECSSDRVTGLAAEVAFFVVLSVFPALLVMASALGFLDSIIGNQLAQEAQQRVISFLQRVLTQNAGDTIAVVRRLFTDQRTGLLTFSVLAGVWATARGFASVMRALNIAYDVVEDRSWLRRQGIAVVLSLGTVIVSAVMLSMLVVGPLLGVGGSVAGAAGTRALFATAWHWLRVPVVLLVLVALVGDGVPRRAEACRPVAGRSPRRRPVRPLVGGHGTGHPLWGGHPGPWEPGLRRPGRPADPAGSDLRARSGASGRR